MIIKLQKLLPRLLRIHTYRDVTAIAFFLFVSVHYGKAENKASIMRNAMSAAIQGEKNNVLAIPITGTITDEKGEGLVGATIVIKGTTTGTTTDVDGNFSLEVPDNTTVLVISYAGY